MADTPESSGGGNITVRNIRAERQLSREMTVERMTVNSGEEKSAESDLMNEVREAITDQTQTINEIENIAQQQLNALRGIARDMADMQKGIKNGGSGGGSGSGGGPTSSTEFKETMENLRQAIVALNTGMGGGGEDGGPGPSSNPGDAAEQARRFRGSAGFADAVLEATPALDGMRTASEKGEATLRNLFETGIFERLRGNLQNFADQIQSIGSNLVDMNKVVQGVTERFQQSMDAATSGIAEMSEVFFDFMPGLRRGGDNLVDTVNLIRNSLDNDLISAVGIVGGDLMEVSEAIHQTRMNLREQGVDAVDRLSFREMNEATLHILALERRRDISANLKDPITNRNIASQLEFAQLIATNTGRTADEVIKLNHDRARELANLEVGGILQGDDRENFERAINVFQSDPNLLPFAELLAGIGKSGGSVTAFLGQNPELASDFAASDQLGNLRNLVDAVHSGLQGEALVNALMNASSGFANNPFLGVAGSQVRTEEGLQLAGAGNFARTYEPPTEPGRGISTVRRVQDFVANNLAETGIIVALGLNTAALLANNAALGGMGRIDRMLRNFGRRGSIRALGRSGLIGRAMGGARAGAAGGGLLARLGLGAGAAAAGAGAAGAAGAAAGGAGRAGLGAAARGAGRAGLGAVLRGIPGLGLLAGLGQGAYYGLVQGDWTSAALAAGSGAASTLPGLGTAASLGLSAALVAREGTQAYNAAQDPTAGGPPITPTVGPTSRGTPSTQNAGIRTEGQRLMVEHNRLLGRIITILEEQTGVFENIEANTTRVTAAPPAGWLDGLLGSDDAESTG